MRLRNTWVGLLGIALATTLACGGSQETSSTSAKPESPSATPAGLKVDSATAGDYPRERAEAHYQSFLSALAGESSDELRNLAPELANWAFVQP